MAHTSINRLGRRMEPAARVTVTSPSSMGWRRASSTSRWNSGSSSINSTPLWAKEISPGLGMLPPPIIATADSVWWGARKGRWSSRGCLGSVRPATDQTSVASRDSCRVISGRMEGSRRASMDFPAPGLPMSSTLCPPAAAISSARFTFSCPITSEKSGRLEGVAVSCAGTASISAASPRRWRTKDAASATG